MCVPRYKKVLFAQDFLNFYLFDLRVKLKLFIVAF